MLEDFIQRRKHVRIPLVNVIKAKFEDRDPVSALIVDLSLGGARVLSKSPIHIGEQVLMTVPLLEEKIIQIEGEVVWARQMEQMKDLRFGIEYMAGVRFKEFNEDVEKFVKLHTKK